MDSVVHLILVKAVNFKQSQIEGNLHFSTVPVLQLFLDNINNNGLFLVESHNLDEYIVSL